MNELKDTFAKAANHEPPLRISADSVLRGGRARQRRRSVLAAVSGAAVATLAVTVVVALPRHSPGPGAPAGADVSVSPTGTPAAPTPTPTPTHEPFSGETLPSAPTFGPPSLGLLDTAHVREVTNSMERKSSAMVAALTRELEASGYTVGLIDNKSDFLPETDGGLYDYRIPISKGGQRGEVSVSSSRRPPDPLVADPSRGCAPDMYACSVVKTSRGGTARFNSDNRETRGANGRHVAVWWSGVITQAQYFNQPAGLDLKLPDELLLSLATDPSLDLGDVLTFTPDELKSFKKQTATARLQQSTATELPATNG